MSERKIEMALDIISLVLTITGLWTCLLLCRTSYRFRFVSNHVVGQCYGLQTIRKNNRQGNLAQNIIQ